MNKWETIAQTEDFIIDYDKDAAIYRVSYFQDNHFVDDVIFDSYDTPRRAMWRVLEIVEGGARLECSACGHKAIFGRTSAKFCPNCGADMRGVSE